MAGSDAPRPRGGFLFAPLAGATAASLSRDVLAGLVLAGLLVPQGLGYAAIAGVEVQRGLYAAAVGLFTYVVLGSSRHLAVSPTSSSAAMLAAAVTPLAAGDPAAYGGLAAGVALGTGLLLVLGCVLRLGFVSDFIAKPVLKGFTFGLALRIVVGQAPALLGVPAGSGSIVAQAGHVLGGLGSAHVPTLVVGVGALALMLLLPRLTRAVPPGLAALALALGAVKVFGLADHGVKVLGSVPTGLPVPGLPGVGFADADALWAAGLGIAVIVYVESLGAARTMGAKHGYDVNPNRELLALGGANLVSGLFHGICVGGGLSAAAANDAAGARSGAAALTASAVVLLTVLFLMPVFALLPSAVLAAIVIDAVRRLVDVKELARYVRLRSGTVVHLTAAVGVVALGVLPGMLLAVLLSIVLVLRVLSRPEVSELGRLGDSRVFVPLGSEPGVAPVPGLAILRPEGPLFYANADRVRERVREVLGAARPPRQLLLNLGATPRLGIASNDALVSIHDELTRAGVELALARVSPEVRGFMARAGLLDRVGAERVFTSQNDAIDAYLARPGGGDGGGAVSGTA